MQDRAEFTAMKTAGELPFGQVPCLVITAADGTTTKLAQSSAILRYVCQLSGLYPADPVAAARVDASVAAEGDAFASFVAVSYPARNGLDHLDAAALAEAFERQRGEVLPRHFGHLERALADSATGWVCGTPVPSPADFAWGTHLFDVRANAVANLPADALAPFPRINAFLNKFLALAEVKKYYELP